MPATTGGRQSSGNRQRVYKRPKPKPYSPPTPEKFIAPAPQRRVTRGVRRSGTTPSAPGRAPVSRIPKSRRQQQRINAKQTLQRVKKVNRRIKREKKAEKAWERRQLVHHFTRKQPGPMTNLDRYLAENHYRSKKFQDRLGKTAEERRDREDKGFQIKDITDAASNAGEDIKKAIVKSPLAKRGGTAAAGDPRQGLQSSGPGSAGVLKEVTDLAANAPASAYMTTEAVVGLAKGNPKKAKQLWKDFKDSSAISAAVSGNWDEAAKRAAERPLTTGLELSGAKAIVGRGVGGAARRAPVPGKKLRGKVRKVGSLDRADLKLYPGGDGPRIGRQYSRDAINKGVQVLAEKRIARGRKERKIKGRTVVKGRAPGDPNLHTPRHALPNTGRARSRPLQRMVDTDVFAFERARQPRKQRAVHESAKHAPGGRRSRYRGARVRSKVKPKEGGGVQLLAEGTVRASDIPRIRADLRARLREVGIAARDLKDRDEQGYKQNREEAKSIREALAADDAKLLQLVEAAGAWTRSQEPVQARGRRAGAWDEVGQSKRFFPALQSHVRRPETEERRGFTDEEVDIVTKAVQRRYRQGKPIPPRIAAALGLDGQRMFHGTDAETAARVRESGGFLANRRDTVWVGSQQVARGYGDNVVDVYVNAKKPIYSDDPHFFDLTRDAGTTAERNAILRREGYDAIISPDGSGARAILALDKSIVKVAPKRRTRIGEPGGLTRARVAAAVAAANPKRRVRVPSRKLDADELATTARVLQRRQRRGKDTLEGLAPGGPAFVTQRQPRLSDQGTDTDVYAPNFPAPFEPTKARRGPAFERGTREVGSDALMRQAATAETQVTAAEGFQLIDRKYGVAAGKKGKRYASSKEEAALAAAAYERQYGMKMVPVRIDGLGRVFGSKLKRKQNEGMRDRVRWTEEADMESSAMRETWDAAIGESKGGRWVLMPDDVVARFREHGTVSSRGVLMSATNWFKDVVLTSASPTRWIGGNVSDLTLRTAFAGITPFDIYRGQQAVRRTQGMGLEGEQTAAALSGGGLYTASEALNKVFTPSVVNENPLRTIAATPWRAWKGLVYNLEHKIEVLPQYGAVGKELRRQSGYKYEQPASRAKPSGPELAAARAERNRLTPPKELKTDIRKRIPYERAQKMTNNELEVAIQRAGAAEQRMYAVAQHERDKADAELAEASSAAPRAEVRGNVMEDWQRVSKGDVPKDWTGKRAFKVTRLDTEKLRDEFGIKGRVNVRLIEGARGYHRTLKDGSHEIGVVGWLKPEAAARQLRHELEHARQVEAQGLPTRPGSEGDYRNMPTEVEARAASERASAADVSRIGEVDLGTGMEIATLAQRAKWEADVYRAELRYRRALQDAPLVAANDAAMKASLSSLLRLHNQQIDNYATKLVNDNALAQRIQLATEDVIGRWGKVSPSMRKALGVAPFAQWLAAATRYTFVTLPTKHPIKTGLIAAMSEMTEEERIRLGLSFYATRPNQVQEYQMGSLPTEVGRNKYGPTVSGNRTARSTSFGTAAGVLMGQGGDFILPQFMGALNAWAGESFTGEDLTYPDWWPQEGYRRLPLDPDMRTAVALGSLLEVAVPFASAFRRTVLERGRPSEPYSTILSPATRQRWDEDEKAYVENEGTTLGGILEWLMPVAPKGKLYTYGAGKAIEENAITGETLEGWAKRAKKAEGHGFGGGDTTSGAQPTYGFGGNAERGPKGRVKPKSEGFGF